MGILKMLYEQEAQLAENGHRPSRVYVHPATYSDLIMELAPQHIRTDAPGLKIAASQGQYLDVIADRAIPTDEFFFCGWSENSRSSTKCQA